MSVRTVETVVERLCDLSRAASVGAYDAIVWPDSLPDDAWYMSPELISVFDSPAWDAMTDAARKRLSFFECVNFFSLNIHGEKSLIQGLTSRLYAPGQRELTRYLHHFIDEENKHMAYFGTFCERYAKKIYPDRKLPSAATRESPVEDALFFLRILIFEEVVDTFNVTMAKDERLHPTARRINELHHLDETRHLAFGRLLLRDLLTAARESAGADAIEELTVHASDFLDATWREYFNVDAYRDARLPDVFQLRSRCLESEAARTRRARMTRRCTHELAALGLFVPSVTGAS